MAKTELKILKASPGVGAVALAAAIGGAACRPDLGAPPSLIDDFTVLAVRGVADEAAGAMRAPGLAPLAEARPGQNVRYDLLAVTPAGTIPAAPAIFSLCRAPKPPAEGNSVSATCATAPAVGAALAIWQTAIPTDVCSLFGPITPPVKSGEPPLRPRDPDATGGFYLPVRAVAPSPTVAGAARTAFALTRVQCNLGGASADILQAFANYLPNRHPRLGGAFVAAAAGARPLTLDPAASAPVKSGEEVTLEARFADDASETYLWFDPVARAVVNRREALSLSWFVTAGEVDADRTGRDEAEVTPTSSNTWHAPVVTAVTDVHLWLVLRDSRGGIDFSESIIRVVP